MNALHSSTKTTSFKTVHECHDYVTDELDRFESLPIHVIHLYLSAAIPEIQKKVGSTDSDLLQLLKSCPDLFEINDMLEVSNSKYHKERNSDRFVDRSGTLLPQKIENGRGSISRLFAAYGFINVTYPFQTSVYFSSRLFNDSYKLVPLDLSQFRVKDLVGFDAEFGKGNNDTPYRATKVWKVYEDGYDDDEEEDRYSCDSRRSKASSRSQNSPRSKKNYPKAKKGSQTSLSNQSLAEDKIFYSRNETKIKSQAKSNDTQPKLTSKPPNYKKKVRNPIKIKADGIINNLFMNYGFITSRENKSDRVFFALSVCKMLKHTSNLAKTYKVGDIVKFTAVPSSKKGSKVMWEATSVVLKADYVDSASSSDETSSEEIVVPAKEKQKKASIKETSKEIPNSSLSKSTNSLKNYQGKIYPLSDTTAIIKFGPNFLENATAETCEFYLGGERIIDVRWEFHDGDFVYFDATRSSGSQWDVSLVWQGEKPDIPEIGSETEDELCQEQQSYELETSLPTAEFAHNVPNTSINWGDTPYPGEDLVDECSPRDSESYYSSTESHLSTDVATTSKRKKQDGEREAISNSNLNEDSNQEYSNDAGDFLEKNHLNIKENIVENGNDCKIINKENNQNQGTKYLLNKNSETCNSDVDSNILNDEACNNAYGESSKFLSSMKENEFSNIENFINIKSDKKSKTVSKQNLAEIETKKANKFDNEPSSKSKSNTPEAKELDSARTLAKPASISMFENVKGKITKIYRIHIDVCLESDKHIALIWNDLYHEGVLIREKCKDLKELLKLQDELLLNFFQITDDHGLAFHKVSLAWIGEKPQNVKEIEPRVFIETQNLEVSCKIPSRKDFFKTFSKKQASADSENLSKTQLKGSAEGNDESMEHLNQSTTKISDGATGARKKSFLSTSFASSNGNPNRDSVDTDTLTHRIPLKIREFMTPADVSSILFSRVQKLKQSMHNPTLCLQVIGQLERDLKSAVAILQPQLTLPNSSEIQTSSADRGCQTTESMLMPLDNEIIHSTDTCTKTREVSTAMQTLITGDIIAAAVFPH